VAPDSNLKRLHEAGVSIWLDTLSRQLLQSGDFAGLIRDFSVTGTTSNPTIFAKAITGSDLYDGELRELADAGQRDLQELFFSLALDDVRGAARELRATFDESDGRDGFISFECTPDLADDTEATIAQALDLWQRLAQPNVMIKVRSSSRGSTPRSIRSSTSARRCAGTSRWPTPGSPTNGAWRSSPGRAGRASRLSAPRASGRCGRARAPRTPPTRTSFTSQS
jgi:hypothetical protein